MFKTGDDGLTGVLMDVSVCVCVSDKWNTFVLTHTHRANDFPFKKNEFSVSHLVNYVFFRFGSFCSP